MHVLLHLLSVTPTTMYRCEISIIFKAAYNSLIVKIISNTRNVSVGHGCLQWQSPLTHVKLAASQTPIFKVIFMSCWSLCVGMHKIHQGV